jgi:hypothetical protein
MSIGVGRIGSIVFVVHFSPIGRWNKLVFQGAGQRDLINSAYEFHLLALAR